MKANEKKSPRVLFLSFFFLLLFSFTQTGCSTTLSTLQPAETLPQGHVQVTAAYDLNLPVSRIVDVIEVGKEASENALNSGEAPSENARKQMLLAATGLLLNPPGMQADFMARYGLFEHLDVGLRYSTTALHADVKYQFLDAKTNPTGLDASVSLGMSKQVFNGLVFDVLDQLQLDYSKYNIEIPILFGKEFQVDKTPVAHLWFGPKYIGSKYSVDAKFKNQNLVDRTDGYMHYLGGVVGGSVGYKYLFLVTEITGMYMIANPVILGSKTDLGGFVVMPSIGLMARF